MTEHGICAKCKKSVGCSYADDRITGCKKFVLEPELEPMTNEEWFCSLSTEEKAEFSMRVFKNCAWCLDGSLCPFNEFPEHCPTESKENMMKWLKEKHE